MQVIFLPRELTILLVFILWPIIQATITFICHKIDDSYFSYQSLFFKPSPWEKDGDIYKRLFKVNKWKKFMPDGAAAVKGEFKMRHLDFSNRDNLEKFLVVSCRGETAHWLSIIPFWVFGFFTPPIVIFYMLLYSLAANLPCIIVQRYNRPRVAGLLQKQACI
jgi:glycosyl-4,4'-diaponeurosporenoate acyltransferase